MIDDSEYHWRQVAACADDETPNLCLSQRPYLDAALRAIGYVLEGDPDGALLRAVCREAMTRRMAMAGDDD